MSSVSTRLKTHQRANQKRGYIEKYVNIIDALARLGTREVRRTNRSRSFAVLFADNRDLKIEVFRHFLRTSNVKKSRDQALDVRFAV